MDTFGNNRQLILNVTVERKGTEIFFLDMKKKT